MSPWCPQIISIVTAGSKTGKGLFFPEGLNGVLNGSAMASSSPTEMATAMSPPMAMAGRKILQAMAPAPAQASSNVSSPPAT